MCDRLQFKGMGLRRHFAAIPYLLVKMVSSGVDRRFNQRNSATNQGTAGNQVSRSKCNYEVEQRK